jgi:hypothetical protein
MKCFCGREIIDAVPYMIEDIEVCNYPFWVDEIAGIDSDGNCCCSGGSFGSFLLAAAYCRKAREENLDLRKEWAT